MRVARNKPPKKVEEPWKTADDPDSYQLYTPDAQGKVTWFSLKIITTPLDILIDFCVICQSEVVENDKKQELSCEHRFHKMCIKYWRQKARSNKCPQCMSTSVMTELQSSIEG